MTINLTRKYLAGHPRAGELTYFVEKVYSGFYDLEHLTLTLEQFAEFIALDYASDYLKIIGQEDFLDVECKPKIHTMRSGNRWRAGMDIHFKIWKGKPYKSKTFNFAPIIPCVSVQDYELINIDSEIGPFRNITIDGRELSDEEVQELAVNDGFDNVEDFWDWFQGNCTGQLIHWTDKRY